MHLVALLYTCVAATKRFSQIIRKSVNKSCRGHQVYSYLALSPFKNTLLNDMIEHDLKDHPF